MRAAVLGAILLTAGFTHSPNLPGEIDIFVMPDGDVTINNGPLLSVAKFKEQMKPLLHHKPCIPFRIRSGPETSLEPLSRIVFFMQDKPCGKMGFILSPPSKSTPAN